MLSDHFFLHLQMGCLKCIAKCLATQGCCPHCKQPASIDQFVNCRWAGDLTSMLTDLKRRAGPNENPSDFCHQHESTAPNQSPAAAAADGHANKYLLDL